jgi:carbon storage regulator
MLVLSRKQSERVVIGQDIVITVLEARDGRVRLGFESPQEAPIYRKEVLERIARAEVSAPVKSLREESKFYAECG